jgi:hypothetical protein
MEGFDDEDKIRLYGAFGGTALYLRQVQKDKSVEENIKNNFLKVTAYLYEEPLLLLRQEVQELGILYKETPFGEKSSARKTIYGISDFMFRFWYRYVFGNRSLLETGASEVVWTRRILPDYSDYMGLIFEKVCQEYLYRKNSLGELPILFTSIGRWWGTDPKKRQQAEIDLIAGDENDYLICECKWRNEAFDLSMLNELRYRADVFNANRGQTWYYLFSKSGFTQAVLDDAKKNETICLVDLRELVK